MASRPTRSFSPVSSASAHFARVDALQHEPGGRAEVLVFVGEQRHERLQPAARCPARINASQARRRTSASGSRSACSMILPASGSASRPTISTDFAPHQWVAVLAHGLERRVRLCRTSRGLAPRRERLQRCPRRSCRVLLGADDAVDAALGVAAAQREVQRPVRPDGEVGHVHRRAGAELLGLALVASPRRASGARRR